VTRAAKAGKRRARRASAPPREPAPSRRDDRSDAAIPFGETFSTSSLSLHELFEQQAAAMLERADIDEEQRQGILVAMACPCCGAGGMSFSVKLKPRK
jgi:hypothetical protein